MDLIDRQTINNTVIRLNEEGWEITRYEHKRITNVLCEMPTVDAVPMSVIEEIKAKIDFEEKWLTDIWFIDKKISTDDVNIAMDGIRKFIERKVKEQTDAD